MTDDTITIPCAFPCRNSGILALLLCLVLLTAAPYAAAQDRSMRRITVPAQMPDGRQTPLPLYAGCHALVVGCSEYETPRAWPRLPNPVKDARDVAQTLTVLGWQVQLVENPTGAALRRELNRLVTDVGRQEDQGILIWFSGHGYTRKEADGSRLGYIVPVDAPDPMKDPGVFMERAVDMRFLEGIARGILSRHVLMVFDSCFSGAIFQVMRASPSPYLEEKIARPVREFITAGREDETVPDRSLFKDCFIQAIRDGYGDHNQDGYVTGEELGSYLTEQVVNHTRGAQHPQFGKINNPLLDKGDFVFALAGGGGPRPEQSPGKTQPKAGDERLDPVTGMVFVWVPEGRFTMGSPVREAGRDSDEGPVDAVTMNGFWMGKHEVTRGQFRKFVEATRYVTDAEKAGWSWYWNTDEKKWDRKNGLAWQRAGFEQGDDHPVVHVSWNDANAMVEWMNRTGTDTVRLPTEAQWEYACRGGTRTVRFWGDSAKAACEFANVADQTSARQFNWEPIHPCADGFVYSAPVGSFRPNPFGLHDMLGNVWEWCADAYSATANTRSAAQNLPGSGAESDRVGRGGGWNGHPDSVRSANRNHDVQSYRDDVLGFRLVRMP